MHARRESDNQQVRPGITEGGDRSAMVVRMFLAGLIEERG
jgi:hypothetical protein